MTACEPRNFAVDRLEAHGPIEGSFEYSAEFRGRVLEILRGMESFPNYQEYIFNHLGGPGSRLMQFVRYLVPEIEYRCGSLREMRVLDFVKPDTG